MKYQEKMYGCLLMLASWCIKADEDVACELNKGLLGYWDSLSNAAKLAIEALLVLVVLYLVMRIFGCKKCVGSCGCDKTLCRTVDCSGENIVKNEQSCLCPCGCGCSEENCRKHGCECGSCSCVSCK